MLQQPSVILPPDNGPAVLMRAKMCSDEWVIGGVFLRFHRPWSSKTCSELARSESMCQEVAILQPLNHPESIEYRVEAN